jgi:hypothetical protein
MSELAMEEDLEERRRWHVGREVPIALLIGLGMQTLGGVLWLGQLSSKIDSAIATINEFKTERYTQHDARRDKELVLTMIETLRAKDGDLDRRMTAHEERDARELWNRNHNGDSTRRPQ